MIGILLMLAGFCLYGSSGQDDSHITFWASYTLKETGEILNYNGDRIEQSSSLLLTVIIAFFSKASTIAVVTTGYLIALIAAALAIYLSWQLLDRLQLSCKKFTIVLLATSPAFLSWASSGMEGTLAAACVLWFILVWGDLLHKKTSINARSLLLATIATGCFISVRPEMVIVVAVAVFTITIWKKLSGSNTTINNTPTLWLGAVTTLCILALTAWRYYYFGAVMPLPVSAKAPALTIEKIREGLLYLLHFGFLNITYLIGLIYFIFYLINTFRNRIKGEPDKHHLLLAGIIYVLYAAFIVCSGGDWMPMGRFLVPVLPLAAMGTALATQSILKKYTDYKNYGACFLFSFMILLNILANGMTLTRDTQGIPLWSSVHLSSAMEKYSPLEKYNQVHVRDLGIIDALDETINKLAIVNKDQPVTLISASAGLVYFHIAKMNAVSPGFKKIFFYDIRGLTEKSLTDCPLTNRYPRRTEGLAITYDEFLSQQPLLDEQCHIKKPDIIFEFNDMYRELPQKISRYGYTMIYQEGGRIIENDTFFPTHGSFATDFIMVRNDLLPTLGNPTLQLINYNAMPLVQRWPW